MKSVHQLTSRFRRRRGFTLYEAVVALGLILIVLDLSTRVFRTGLQSIQQVQAAEINQRQIDSALNALAGDVWRGATLEATGNSVRVGFADGSKIRWQINSDGSIHRSEDVRVTPVGQFPPASRTTHWQADAAQWSFARDGDCLLVRMPRRDPLAQPEEARLVSQILAGSR